MGIIVLIILILVIATLIVIFLIKNGKEAESIVEEFLEEETKDKPKEPVKETQKPVVENDKSKEENDKPKEEKEPEKEKNELEKEYDKYDYENAMNYFLAQFWDIVKVENGSSTWNYLLELLKEAKAQYNDKSEHHLPMLYKEECFPNIYNFYGDEGDEEKTFKTLVGWLFAMQLVELRPQDRTVIYKIGYELGGYDKDTALYGWKFKCDPNIARMVAAAIYAAMRGACNPDVEAMREECGFEWVNNYCIEEIKNYVNPFEVEGKRDFYVDLREFMPTAPGPYAPHYQDRSKIGGYPFPNDLKADDYNLVVDKDIREAIIKLYNLDNFEYKHNIVEQKTVQAIADKDANYNHLFGKERSVDEYTFQPVFTEEDLGCTIYPTLAKELCNMVDDVLHIGSYQRCILQGHEDQMYPPQYGRLRPGCSWEREAHRHSDDDNRQNVLVNFPIEENDGNPTGYYNKDGDWTNKDGIHSPEEYEDVMKDELWANSYPSGHSAGIMAVVLLLIELLPFKADKLLSAANKFAINRTIARYHWNSDTIQGRILATCISSIIRCCTDFNERLEIIKKYLNK